jgi:integrase
MVLKMKTPNLSNPNVQIELGERKSPYWNILQYGRHIGLEKEPAKPIVWLGRIRTKAGGYKQFRVGPLVQQGGKGLTYYEALKRVEAKFAEPEIAALASKAYSVGTNQILRYSPSEHGLTIGDAMIDYVEWKRIAATQKNFLVLLSLINHHIIPRLGDIQLADFTGNTATSFCRDILETPAARGKQESKPRVSIGDLDADTLRKRKSTVNTLIGILRLAFKMAWENGRTDNERAWRCIRRLPNYEAPRQIFLTRIECRELITHCREDLSFLVRGALYSGCRVTELAELRCQDIGKDVFGLFVATEKSRKSRHVILPEEGMQFFLNMCLGKEPNDFVFRTERNQKWNGLHKYLFKAAVRTAGLPEQFVFHGLRHTYASQLVQAGASLAVVARQLGHSNTDTVSRTYGHLSSSSIERELELRFAPLCDSPVVPDPNLTELRLSLQGNGKALPSASWPTSNFSLFEGELLPELKHGLS